MAKAQKKPAREVGRPSLYSANLAEKICELIADGKSLREICANPGFPHRTTVLRWLVDHQDFATKYAYAREMQADVMDDKILETAEACTPLSAMADRVKIAAYQWRASKLRPKVYGDKVGVEASGSLSVTIATGVPSDD